ncbi:M56 family metallopeptidase [Hufsiella ginkgonis]|uniref:Peptidase M56 domain-containing protein n=1 Tax=Hufsiella ginkgonis TaxID=2695274 RepID=A0A7K1XUT9_9SPHI|nr:M56 family metallopeptidase [Hufsiella ginkgonis]MXV14567.1 hypothetical protein [Hufsiella ginkgonis]
MPQLFIILFKINLVLLLFAAAYYGVLRRLTFYTLNRSFLVFGIVFSSAYPFIDLTDLYHRFFPANDQLAAYVPELNQRVTGLTPPALLTVNWELMMIVFYAGTAAMALRLIIQLVSLYGVHRRSAPGSVANHPVRILTEAMGPFSFWRNVYINPALHRESELRTILEHEKIHIRQWHTADILLAELSIVFYWFNPGVWLIKKAVKENLEFITDEKMLTRGVDRKTYQYSLLAVGNLAPATTIATNFNLSDLKKRILMMNSRRSSRLTLGRYVLVLPVLLLITLAFTVSDKEIQKQLAPLQQVFIRPGEIKEASVLPAATTKKNIAFNATGRARTAAMTEISIVEPTKAAEIDPAQIGFAGVDPLPVTSPPLPAEPVKKLQLRLRTPGIIVNTPAENSGDDKVVTVVGYSSRLKSSADTTNRAFGTIRINGKQLQGVIVAKP